MGFKLLLLSTLLWAVYNFRRKIQTVTISVENVRCNSEVTLGWELHNISYNIIEQIDFE